MCLVFFFTLVLVSLKTKSKAPSAVSVGHITYVGWTAELCTNYMQQI